MHKTFMNKTYNVYFNNSKEYILQIDVLNMFWQQFILAATNYQPLNLILYKNNQPEILNIKDSELDIYRRKISSYYQFSSTELDLQRFVGLCKLIKILINHMETNCQLTTIRDIYYQDVDVFQNKQSECCYLLTQLVTYSLKWSLISTFNIHPTQKSLMYGDYFTNISLNEPILIPINFEQSFQHLVSDQRFLLIVIEKDAVFQSFCSHLKSTNQLKNYLIITTKGYSDKLALRFINWLKNNFKPIIYCFFDSDVHGINIFRQLSINIHGLVFAGVFLSESKPTSWLSITYNDVLLLLNLLNKDTIIEKCHRELTRGLFLYKKSEMNVVANKTYNDYIMTKLKLYEQSLIQ
ncbi:unnamed protein product [Candida verbasci]|uniref:DNA topoisomerase (ATP-hydrolyzing) n=1 Tax=Candida verbasci TaxID=1227364 RepID=A0A9W4TWT8_9ASCO|nr:unnamed protein product [Candida verbasci]